MTRIQKLSFRYPGKLVYISHEETKPASFILASERYIEIIEPSKIDDKEHFDPKRIVDARKRILRSINQRRGQQKFRNALIRAYRGKCAITDCSVIDVLEAAHIHPYRGPETNKVTNGLLLRSDIHTLFDCGLLAINSDKLTVVVSEDLKGSEYEKLNGKKMRTPRYRRQWPNAEVLKIHRRASHL